MRTSARTVAVILFDEVELLDVAGPLQVLDAGRPPLELPAASGCTRLRDNPD